jgi:hypothetical protein
VLKESELQLNDQLDRRHFGHLLSKTFGRNGAGLVLEYLTIILISQWHLKHTDEEFAQRFLPQIQANAATVLATATNIIISADGALVATVTPVIDTTTLQGYVCSISYSQLVERNVHLHRCRLAGSKCIVSLEFLQLTCFP